jgi:hypothetical protein
MNLNLLVERKANPSRVAVALANTVTVAVSLVVEPPELLATTVYAPL